ncbi:hypothetical protein EDD39_4846 [Kitasatospora cineracea]|uniref:DDE superfamily endonuclease n=1 Tax=Kitasatospora cineracea TaxID=88074 RepID=A0A8G1XFK4_9ACTN|nr:hypothetical protein [Kitasatospora cineracea]ROR46566.1 hypothetical protein EDD39_4846 [Kitasatospora cineracea]
MSVKKDQTARKSVALPVRARPQPEESIWSPVKRDIGTLAAANLDQITRTVKRRLKQIQHHPDLVDRCLVGTGLLMDG